MMAERRISRPPARVSVSTEPTGSMPKWRGPACPAPSGTRGGTIRVSPGGTRAGSASWTRYRFRADPRA
jgi:hypothetical protein